LIEFEFGRREDIPLMMKHLLILLPILLAPICQAQQGGKERGYFRVVCLGDPPAFETREVNGVMVQQEYAEGSVPPREVTFSGASVKVEEGETTQLHLRRMTKYVEVIDRNLRVEAKVDGKLWAKLPAPKSPITVAMFRDRSEKKLSWNKVKYRTFKDDLASFPVGKARLINMTRVPIAFKIGDAGKAFEISPGNVKLVGSGDGFSVGNNMVVIATKQKGKWREIFRNRLKLFPNHRLSVYFYESDRQDRKGDIKAKVQFLELTENPAESLAKK